MQANPDVLYLWGDNEARVGRGGQAAEMRGEPNGIGIRTKRTPGTDESAYWSDDDYERQITLVYEDFERVFKNIHRTIVIPIDGLGTGMSQLPKRAPRTLSYIEDRIKDILDVKIELAKNRKWQPGETAPKDRSILIWGQPKNTDMVGFNGPGIFTAYWDSIDQAFCLSGASYLGPFVKPLLWMELPEKPELA